jgi:hypothetical protein
MIAAQSSAPLKFKQVPLILCLSTHIEAKRLAETECRHAEHG